MQRDAICPVCHATTSSWSLIERFPSNTLFCSNCRASLAFSAPFPPGSDLVWLILVAVATLSSLGIVNLLPKGVVRIPSFIALVVLLWWALKGLLCIWARFAGKPALLRGDLADKRAA